MSGIYTRRDFLQQIGTAALLLSRPLDLRAQNAAGRPNIIFLLSDDQRYNAMGCMNNPAIKTPNMDKLAADGMVFDNHYNTTAICMASRACIMTGMHEYKTGCNFTYGPVHPELFAQSYPVLLRQAGYRTGFAGKFGFAVSSESNANQWHKEEGMPIDQFDFWAGWWGQGSYDTAQNKYMKKYAEKYPHVTRALGAAGQDFIRQSADRGKPFCLSISFKAPHGPVRPDPEFDGMYDGVKFPREKNFGHNAAEHLPTQAKSGRQYLRLGRAWLKQSDLLARYYQQIYGIDVAIGMIRDELVRQGVADNTVIIYTTDNGFFCGAHAMGGKVLPYEEGSRAPLIIYDPRHKSSGAKRRSLALTANIDMAPTILDMAGLAVPNNIDGRTLVPVLDKPDMQVRESLLLTQVWGPCETHALAVVTPRWKYIYWMYGNRDMPPSEELYDMQTDRIELANEAKNPLRKEALRRMHALYDKHIEKWKKDCVADSRYQLYGRLADRNIPWPEKTFGKQQRDKRNR
jgi:arylsulfatase A-like enzyme